MAVLVDHETLVGTVRIGIVGHGAEKFTENTEAQARYEIEKILRAAAADSFTTPTVVSGHSPLGGIDIWAEEVGADLGCDLDIKTPRQNRWDAEYGYKARNLDIADSSDVIYVIVVKEYPPNYKGMRFKSCYHCHKTDHIKSGGCWTAIQAQKLGKPAYWIIL